MSAIDLYFLARWCFILGSLFAEEMLLVHVQAHLEVSVDCESIPVTVINGSLAHRDLIEIP